MSKGAAPRNVEIKFYKVFKSFISTAYIQNHIYIYIYMILYVYVYEYIHVYLYVYVCTYELLEASTEPLNEILLL